MEAVMRTMEKETDSPILSAAHALLSLIPMDGSSSVVRGGGVCSRRMSTEDFVTASYPSTSAMVVSPMPTYSMSLDTDYKRMPYLYRPHILNLPTMLTVPPKRSTTVSSCESSLDGGSSEQSDWTLDPNVRFYDGSVSLSLKEDEESLSLLHCFMRKYCVEAFSASAEDVSTPRYGKSHGRSIVVGQVGIQCIHCKHRPYATRQERAVCFPSSLKNIYHSIETWQRRHSLVCEDIPMEAKITMTELMGKSRSGAGGRRQYWEESARRLGMVDTPTGIRFLRPPGDATLPVAVIPMDTVSCASRPSDHTVGLPVVSLEDRELVTDYLFTLLNQMETCVFTEQDRVGGRSKVKDCPIGYPGLQCKHCGGKAGFGRYFPVSIQALTSANSDRNIFNHVDKCRRCPEQVRKELNHFLVLQQNSKNRRGNRKLFFQIVWERMHGQPPSAVC
jgi:hypothetical protein